MKIVHSLWSKPWERVGIGGVRGGYPTPEHYWASWAYSVLTAGRNYDGNLELVTDSVGAFALVDRLQLPFRSVRVVLDDIADVDPSLWAAGKIVAYGLQDEPFFHIDGDSFLMKKLPGEYEMAEVVAQSWESVGTKRGFEWEYAGAQHVAYFTHRVDGWDERVGNAEAYCMGIFGGSNVGLIREYSEQALRMIRDVDNRAGWERIDLEGFPKHRMNIVVEQQAAYCFLANRNVTPLLLLKPYEMGQAERVGNQLGFIHLQGRRRGGDQADKMLARLATDFPETAERVKALVRDFPSNDPQPQTVVVWQPPAVSEQPQPQPTPTPSSSTTVINSPPPTMPKPEAVTVRRKKGGCGCSRSK